MKSNNNSSTTSGGIGFFGLLTIVFIVLKLLGKISWGWLWVLSPLWISLALVVLVAVIVAVITIFKTKKEYR